MMEKNQFRILFESVQVATEERTISNNDNKCGTLGGGIDLWITNSTKIIR